MDKTRSFGALFVLVFALLAAACTGSVDVDPGESKVTLALRDSGLEIVDIRDAIDYEHVETHSHSTQTVRLTFRPDDGSDTYTEDVPDARVLVSEFDEDGNPDPVEVVAGTGLFDIRIPKTTGTLELHSDDGQLLGRADFDPTALVERQSELMDQSDVVGNPVKVVDHGSSRNKIDILFLPDGYAQRDLRNFHSHVNSIVSKLKRKPAYRDNWTGFNVWRQDVKSSSRSIGSNGRPRDTAFETASGISGVERCVFFANSRGQQAAKALGDRAGADVVIVLANRTRTGGCARNGMIVTARPSHVAETVAHEIGHALFGLMDEYDTPRPGNVCFVGPNVAKSVNNLPWRDMVTTNRLPTPTSARRGTIGAFEGAGYCARGRYRPAHDCLMRTLGKEMCPVCRREVQRTMSRYTGSSSSGSSGSSSSGSSSSGSSSISSPTGLSPTGAITSTDVRLTWNRVSGATNYKVSIQKRSGSSYREFGSVETSGTSTRVTIRDEGGYYRFTVSACKSSGCSTAAQSDFTYGVSSSSGSSSSNTGSSSNSGSTGSLAVPSNLKPVKSSVISDETPSMSWNSVSGATHYKFRMRHHDGNSWLTYVSEQQVNSNRVRTTLREPERWYAFSVAACNSSGCSNWSDFSTMYLRP